MATVKIIGDHHIIFGVNRMVLGKGSIVELSAAELVSWKEKYQIEVLSGDIYSLSDLPRLQKRAQKLQGELAHVLRGLAECAEAIDVPMEVAFSGLSDLSELHEAQEQDPIKPSPANPQESEIKDDKASESETAAPTSVEVDDPLELIGGDWDALRAFVAQHADPHPGPSRTVHEEWIRRTYGGE